MPRALRRASGDHALTSSRQRSAQTKLSGFVRRFCRQVGSCIDLLMLFATKDLPQNRVGFCCCIPSHAFSPWSDMAGELSDRTRQESPEPIDFYEVSLDTARFQSPQEQEPFVEHLRRDWVHALEALKAFTTQYPDDLVAEIYRGRVAEFLRALRPKPGMELPTSN